MGFESIINCCLFLFLFTFMIFMSFFLTDTNHIYYKSKGGKKIFFIQVVKADVLLAGSGLATYYVCL